MAGKTWLSRLISQPYTLEILNELKRKPKRYTELKNVCKNDRTLSKKIEILQENELIVSVPVEIGNKYVNCYKLTKKGEELLRKLEKLDI